MTAEEIEATRQLRRSHVRIVITYVAAGFLFFGGYGMVVYLLVCGKIDEAKSLFLSILPVSTAVISSGSEAESRATTLLDNPHGAEPSPVAASAVSRS